MTATNSYPFLELSRELGVPYGEMLAYVDARRKVEKGISYTERDWWETRAWIKFAGTVNEHHIEQLMAKCRNRWPGIMA